VVNNIHFHSYLYDLKGFMLKLAQR